MAIFCVAACNNCDCIDSSGGTAPEHFIYFSATVINGSKSASFYARDDLKKINKISDNSQIFSAPSLTNKIILLNSSDDNSRKIVLKDLINNDSTEIASSKAQHFGAPVISKDGNKVLFHQNSELYLWNFDRETGGAYLELITSNYSYSNSLAFFSDDDKYIIFVENNNNKFYINIVDTKQLEHNIWQKEISSSLDSFIKIDWIPKKNTLYFVLNDTTIYKYSLDEGESFVAFGDSENLGIKTGTISNNEKYVAFISNTGHLWIKNNINDGFYNLNIEKNNYSDVRWNHDNTKLILLTEENLMKLKDLYVLDIDFNDYVPIIKSKTLVFNGVSCAVWGRPSK